MRGPDVPSPRPQRPVLFVNPASGGGKAGRAGLAESAREHGVEVMVFGPEQELGPLVDDALTRGADALGVAGGDGSLGLVAAAAVAHDLPFVCVPAGTRNHFALDLGLDPDDPVASLAAFADGLERRIDVGDVNGRLFLNNVSLGIYGEAVRQETYRDAKARTLVQTALDVLGPSAAARDLEVVDDRGVLHRSPAVVLVSNNPYSLDPAHPPGGRPVLDAGHLGVLVLNLPRPGEAPGRAWTAERVEVTADGRLHAGVDGEPVELRPPLELVIRPAALRVRIPSSRAAA